jgi:hypothetical protein
MENVGRYLVLGGLLLILIGGALYLSARVGLPPGRLPGDIRIEWHGGGFYFPLVTSILLSAILTVLLNVLVHFLHK